MESRTDSLLAQLTVDEKCHLLGGASSWRTHPIPRLGIPELKMSDGPNGVRGEFSADDRTPSVVVPVGIVQGATWDPELIGRVGDLLGKEARRKSAHVLLAPAVNLHRTPIGGRTFEYFSEDPELTAALGAATVRAVQAHGVAVTVKHFVANDTEVERNSVDVVVDERVLRELYLRPFEVAVREAGAWGVMSAYNKLHGEFCAANDRLLNEILRAEWGFDGFVVSDWFGAHEPVSSANGGLSVEMPGPARVYGDRLAEAVTAGRVDEKTVDALVRDVLVLIERTGAAERSADEPELSVDEPAERALCREVAIAGTVLARNVDGALPLAGDGAPSTLAVIGPNAADTRTMGGGSSALLSLPQRSILEALQDRVPDVVHEVGCQIDKHTPLPGPDQLLGPDGRPGLELRFVNGTDPSAEPAHVTRTVESAARFFGSVPAGVGPGPCVLQLRGSYVPRVDGPHDVGAIVTGRPAIRIGGHQLTRGGERLPAGDAFFGFASTEQLATIDMQAGVPIEIDVELRMKNPFAGLRIGVRPPADDTLLERAVEAARIAEAAVVVVGTNDEWETEGSDRSTIALPGDQDELVRAVAAVNDRTIVVVNAGSPVAMPWAESVPAIVIPFFGGMEMGDAVADVLLGVADPGGRLPTTFPHRLEDAPAWAHYAPVDGVQRYDEGFAIGYRGHDRHGVPPLFAFGHGLSYGSASWGEATASTTTLPTDGSVTVTVPITVDGPGRDATVVVQGYVAPVDPPVEREPKALRTWVKVVVPAGSTTAVALTFDPTAFRRWDTGARDWVVDPGAYDLVIAASATDVRSTIRVDLTPGRG
ncbi:MAG TPA: glycoside hydrolase family 3 C-terminal domain-containing protein [Acidimicrobiales bacterium]|nr:glycoside hydrolase family 3 C-terminal domain-containing protein [Acidimicrobiales bacterium]